MLTTKKSSQISSKLLKIESSNATPIFNKFQYLINLKIYSFAFLFSIILANAHNLSSTDWLGEWKTSEMTKLIEKVRKRFDELQNPSDCNSAKKLVCDLNKACGLG